MKLELLAPDDKAAFRSDEYGLEQPCNRSSTSTQTYRLAIKTLSAPIVLGRAKYTVSHVCQTLIHPARREAFHVRHRLTQAARYRAYNVWKPAVVLRYINFTQASAHQSHAHATLLCASECMHAAQSLADHSDSRPQFHKPRSFFADRGSAGRACSLTLLVPITSQRWKSPLSIHPR